MTYRFDGYNYIIRLEKDELLIETLITFAKEQDLKGAWLSGLGGAQGVELGFYDLHKKQYNWQRFEKLLEITSLQGNLAWKNDEPIWHIHGTFGDEHYNTIAGHIKELIVGGTCELHLHTIFGDQPLARSHNNKIGLELLDL